MYFDKALIVLLAVILWYFAPQLSKEILGNDFKKKNERFSSDWSSNAYGGQMPWNWWNY